MYFNKTMVKPLQIILNRNLLNSNRKLFYVPIVCTSSSPKTKALKKSKIVISETAIPPAAKLSDDIKIHFTKSQKLFSIINKFPQKLLTKRHKPSEHMYVADPIAAQTIAPYLIDDLPKDTPLVEINPGPGVLTEEIVKSHVQNIILYEDFNEFLPILQVSFIFTLFS